MDLQMGGCNIYPGAASLPIQYTTNSRLPNDSYVLLLIGYKGVTETCVKPSSVVAINLPFIRFTIVRPCPSLFVLSCICVRCCPLYCKIFARKLSKVVCNLLHRVSPFMLHHLRTDSFLCHCSVVSAVLSQPRCILQPFSRYCCATDHGHMLLVIKNFYRYIWWNFIRQLPQLIWF